MSAAAASRSDKRRLDLRLVEAGLAESREKARALVMAGRVRVDGVPARKPGEAVGAAASLSVSPGARHVGRGALKLEGALDAFGVDPEGRVAIDVGASTGGFTQVLLERGARRVYAVDVGRGQLHERLRADPRVVVREKLNARHMDRDLIGEPCDLAVVDVSFISALKLLPALRAVLAEAADALVLVKPQFELGRREVGRGGVVRRPEQHARALLETAAAARELRWAPLGVCASPITGAEGNREFFLHLRPGGAGLDPAELEARVGKAVAP